MKKIIVLSVLTAGMAGCGVDWFPEVKPTFRNNSSAVLSNLSSAKFRNHSTSAVTAAGQTIQTSPVGGFVSSAGSSPILTITTKAQFDTSTILSATPGDAASYVEVIDTTTKAVTGRSLTASGKSVVVTSVVSGSQ